MFANKIIDLGPDEPKIIEVAKLAGDFGIEDMTEVVMTLSELFPDTGKSMVFVINEMNAAEVIANFLSLAILQYAMWRFERIEIKFGDMMPVAFFRNMPPEESLIYADKYLNQAKDLIDKYFSNQPAS